MGHFSQSGEKYVKSKELSRFRGIDVWGCACDFTVWLLLLTTKTVTAGDGYRNWRSTDTDPKTHTHTQTETDTKADARR